MSQEHYAETTQPGQRLKGYYVKKVGNHRGKPRIWLEGSVAEIGGFAPGTRYDVEVQGRTVVLQANQDGTRIVSRKVIGERVNPIIELNSLALQALFDGMAVVRVSVKDGVIVVSPVASEIRKIERLARLKGKLERGEALTITSLSHGGGILSHALHTGLAAAGVQSKLSMANEIRPELLEHAREHNDAWGDDTKVFAAPMQEVAYDREAMDAIPPSDILEGGLPCSAASRSGRAKRGLRLPEEHEEVGHLIVASMAILARANPSICLYESVPTYANTASAAILRTTLLENGYKVHERVMTGKEWGEIENRARWFLVGVTEGLVFDFEALLAPKVEPQKLGDILEDIPDDDPRWGRREGLKAKQIRDVAEGKNFKMQIVSEDAENIGTVTKGYSKGRSTDVWIANKNNPEMLRLLTPTEHSAVKNVPPKLVKEFSNTVKHEVMGQAVNYTVVSDLGHHIGNTVNAFAGREEVPLSNRIEMKIEPGLLSDEVKSVASELLSSVESANEKVGRYIGQVIIADGDRIVQDAGRGRGVVHQLDLLDGVPQLGATLDLSYSQGRGRIVEDKDRVREVANNRDR